MKKLLLSTFIILALSSPALAGHGDMKHEMHDHKHHEEIQHKKKVLPEIKKGDAIVSAKGLVCDFCARALEKTFGKKKEVKAIDVNLDNKKITIFFNDNMALTENTIRELITNAGYDVEKVEYAK